MSTVLRICVIDGGLIAQAVHSRRSPLLNPQGKHPHATGVPIGSSPLFGENASFEADCSKTIIHVENTDHAFRERVQQAIKVPCCRVKSKAAQIPCRKRCCHASAHSTDSYVTVLREEHDDQLEEFAVHGEAIPAPDRDPIERFRAHRRPIFSGGMDMNRNEVEGEGTRFSPHCPWWTAVLFASLKAVRQASGVDTSHAGNGQYGVLFYAQMLFPVPPYTQHFSSYFTSRCFEQSNLPVD